MNSPPQNRPPRPEESRRTEPGAPVSALGLSGQPAGQVVALRESITVPSRSESLLRVRQFVRAAVERARIPDPYTRHLVLAVDEAVTSILGDAADWSEHEPGNRAASAAAAEVEVTIDIDSVRVLATIRDSITEYSMDTASLCLQSVIDATRQHELGIFLMRKLCDEVNYSFKKGFQNHLELLKFLY